MPFQPSLLGDKSVFLTVWDEAWAAISNPRMYVRWAVQPLRRSVAYASILLAVMAIVTTVYVVLTLRPQWLQLRGVIASEVPAFSVTNGELSIAEGKTFSFSDNSDVFVRVDASDSVADLAIDPFYEFGLVIAKDGYILRYNGEVSVKRFSDLFEEDLSMDGPQLAASLNRGLWFMAVLAPFAFFAALFLTNMAYTAFISAVISLASGFRFPFAAVWNMSLYALTPFLLASHVFFIFYPNTYLPWLVYVAYMFLALYHFRRFLDLKAQMS